MTIVVGIYPTPYDHHPHSHDFNCAIIKDTEIFACEEKKLFGYKFDDGTAFPYRSLIAGLKELKIKPKNVNKWVFTCPKEFLPKIMMKQLFCDKLKVCKHSQLNSFIKNNISSLPHHEAHISMAKNSSNFKNSYVLSIDGGGDGYDKRNLVLGKYINNKFKILFSSKKNTGLAGFHAVLTDTLGFGVDNGKTSGFASYGRLNTELYKKFEKFFKIKKNKNPIFFCSRKKSEPNFENVKFENFSLHKYLNTSPSNNEMLKITKKYSSADVAQTGEQIVKDKLINFINFNLRNQENSNLICVGGLFHNVAINQFLIDNTKFKKIFFSMSAGDGGLGLGLAFNQYLKLKKKFKNIKYFSNLGLTPFLGPSFKKKEIQKLLSNNDNIIFKKLGNKTNSYIVSKIIEGEIVGVFRGRGEYGPRSLGNRSILADPRNLISKVKINNLIKRRDWFMPFAPAVLKEKYSKYFDEKSQSPYMQTSPKSNKLFRKIASAGVHVDGTSRAQVVEKETNKSFWELINLFGKKTDTYCLLNTSFNRHGISTVGHPHQALEHLLNGSIDTLIIEDYLVKMKHMNKKKSKHKHFTKNSEKKLLKVHEVNYHKKLKLLNY